jgi:hypothetical protein
VLFSEKVADIFEAVANVLPPYQQIYTICKRRLNGSQVDTQDERLAMLMSYAYADVVKLCLDMYRIFFRDVRSKCRLLRISSIDCSSEERQCIEPLVLSINSSRNYQTAGTWS